MSTETENAPTYSMSEIPEFILRSKKPEMSLKELEYQCQKLGEENHQLQLRILGVNELARLLQDRNELVAVLKDKNKRLEMCLVRLENRCATFERQLKSQKSNSTPSIKPGQSPFIPGPSPKILEGLMQENLELKKTVNSLKKKGSSGYLEAVKTTQLEEFIEQQKLEIDQLRGQINELTASAGVEEVGGVAGGGGMSLPASVTDSGPLKRQLLKMQQTMSVKDRFCTLLSQQVTELQKKLASMQSESSEKSVSEGSPEEPSSGSGHKQETQPQENQKMLEDLKSSLASSQGKTLQLEESVKQLRMEKEDLHEKFEGTSQLYSTLLVDNSELRNEVESLKSQLERNEVDGGGGEVQRLRSEIRELQKTMDGQADHYNKELKNKNLELDSQRVQLEEANIKFAQTDSMLLSCQGELSSKKTELWMKDTELKNIKGQFFELEEQVSILNSANSNLERDVQHFESELKKAAHYNTPQFNIQLKSGGAGPALIGQGITPGMEAAKDSLLPGLKCRNPEKAVSSSSTAPQTHPPQAHVSQPHMMSQEQHLARQQQHGKPAPPSLHIPPPPVIQGSRTNTRSPGPPPKGLHYIPAVATPPGSTNPGTPQGHPVHGSISTPVHMGPSQFTASYSRSTSVGPITSHMRPVVTMPVGTYYGTQSPRQGTPGGMGGHAMFGNSRYHAATPGPRMSASSAGGPPPIPPRYGTQGQVFGHAANFPPLPRPQYYHRPDLGYPYHPETRDRNTGSTSPHPPHDSGHPYNNGGNGGPNSGPQPPPPHY